MVLKSSTTHREVSFSLFCFLSSLNFTFRNLIPFGFRSRKAAVVWNYTETLSFPVYSLHSLPSYDNTVCDLTVILENFYQNFYFELNSRTMDVVMHGRLAEVKIWNAISSLALLILEQFKAQLLFKIVSLKNVRETLRKGILQTDQVILSRI